MIPGYLPLLSCVWVSPTSIIAAGHDCTPLVFAVDGSGQVGSENCVHLYVT